MPNYLKAGSALHSDKYRPDIDGIRAIAVSVVVLSHAFPRLLPGGFIGVDIFFVISGYLISSILIRDLDRGTFSIWRFYNRRVRRIFPALIAVLLAILLAGWFCLFRPEFESLGRHLAASALFSENFLLWSEAGYFDVASELKPTLHLWSLAIEEQFYIFWPMLMFLAHRWRLNFALLFLVLGGLSFAVNIHDVYSDQTAAYYSPLGRAWELMIGSLLAYIQARRPALLSLYPAAQSFAGLVLIGLALALVTPGTDFPGLWATLPTAGAFLLISAGETAWCNRRILATQPMVWCGLISYPLYLWHWPFLSFAHLIFGVKLPKTVAIACIVAAVGCAALTFFFVERRFRGQAEGKRKTVLLLGTMTAALGCSLLVAMAGIGPRLYRFDAPTRTEWSFLRDRFPGQASNPVGIFHLEPDRPSQVLFIGDSHIAQYAERIDRTIQQDATRSGAILAIGGGCIPIEGVFTTNARRRECWSMRDEAYKMAEQPRFRTVVIGGAWNWYLLFDNYTYEAGGEHLSVALPEGRRAALQALGHRIDALTSAGKRVFLLLDNPRAEALDPSTGAVRLSLSAENFQPGSTAEISPDQIALRQELLSWARTTKAIVIDPFDAFCSGNACPTTTETGQPIYKDTGHFNPAWAIDHISFIDAPLNEQR